MSKKLTYADVKIHNKSTDLWIVIHGKVYNITKFRKEHPGGEEVLDENAGKDATIEFDEVGHSAVAIEQLKEFYIGDIIDEENKELKKSLGATSSSPASKSKFCAAGVSALAIALGSIVLYKGYRMSQSN